MKLLIAFLVMASVLLVLVNCSPAKKTVSAGLPATTWETHLRPVIMNNCSPCHIPEKGGNKKAYDNYANVRSDIDEMIRRIELNPADRGFMPFRAKDRLPDSTINMFKRFRESGMPQK